MIFPFLVNGVTITNDKIFRQSESIRFVSIRSDEGLTLETSAFNLFTVANLPNQLSW